MIFKFEFEKIDKGFRITNRETDSQVDILAHNAGVSMIDVGKVEANNKWIGFGRYDYAFSAYCNIQKQCIAILLQYKYPESKPYVPKFWLEKHEESTVCPRNIYKWLNNKALYCIRKRFADHWNEMIESHVDPQARQLGRVLTSTLGPNQNILSLEVFEEIQKIPYLLEDLIKYPAATYALRHVVNCGLPFASLENWMGLYSDTGKTYPALNKTLMNMPRRMHGDIVADLSNTHLKFPLYGRAKIFFSLEEVFTRDRYSDRAERPVRHANIFNKTTNEEIVRVARMARRRGLNYRMNRIVSILDFKHYLEDYPETYNGDLKGLFLRSYRWHNDPRNFTIRTNQTKYTATTKLAVPPWGDIDIKGVTLLKTAGDLERESQRMGHCVQSYTDRCIRGSSFIYHVVHKRQKATIELSSSGRVVQAQGPSNKKNPACEWGRKQIVKKLKKVLTSTA